MCVVHTLGCFIQPETIMRGQREGERRTDALLCVHFYLSGSRTGKRDFALLRKQRGLALHDLR